MTTVEAGITSLGAVNVNGTDVAYEVRGDGDRTALFLGGNLLFDQWTSEFIDSLAASGLRVVLPKLPGYGVGVLPAGCSTAADVAILADMVLQELQAKDVIVIGEGMGGWIALEMALSRANLISQIVLVSPWGIRLAAHDAWDFIDMYAVDPDQLARALYGEAASSVHEALVASSIEDLESYARAEQSMAILAWSPYLHNRRLTTWKEQLTTPMSLISSPDDEFARPGYYRELAKALNISDHAEIKGAPHLVRYAGAQPVIEAITRFVNSREVR